MTSASPLEHTLLEEVGRLQAELAGEGQRRLSLSSRLGEELGFDSLTRVELQRRLEGRLEKRLDGVAMLGARTLRDLIPLLEAGEGGADSPMVGPSSNGRRLIADLSEFHSIRAGLGWHLEKQPDATHVIFKGSVNSTLTYREIWDGASRFATRLLSSGIRPRDRVAMMLPTGPHFLFGFLGVLLAGGTPVPLYPPVSMDRLLDHLERQKKILENCAASFFLIPREGGSVLRGFAGRVKSLREVIVVEDVAKGEIHQQALDSRSAAEFSLIQYTSGSTGEPKGVALTDANLLSNLRVMADALLLQPEDVCVSWLPLYHDMGLIGAWLGSLLSGVPLVLMSPLDFLSRPSSWLTAISEARGTISAGPNFSYQLCIDRIIEEELKGIDLTSWRVAMNGAEPVLASTIRGFVERFKPYGFREQSMLPVYGLAENSLGVLFPPLLRATLVDSVSRQSLEGDRRAVPTDKNAVEVVSSGKPLSEHEVKLVKSDGTLAAEREVGELFFRGPSATIGYYNNPSATAALIDGPWLRSGDLAYRVGEDFFIVGRVKDLIIRAGRNIAPQDIEEIVGKVPNIRRGCVAAFSSIDGQKGTELLIVVAETKLRDTAGLARLRAEVMQAIHAKLDLTPDSVVLVPPRTIPKTSSGKLRRADCRTRFENGALLSFRSGRFQVVQLLWHSLRARISFSSQKVSRVPYALWCYAVFGGLLATGMPFLVLLPTLKARRSLVKALARTGFFLSGIKLQLRGAASVESAPIIVSNHESYLDAIILTALLPVQFAFVAKRDFINAKLVCFLLSLLGTVFVERSDAQQGAKDFQEVAKKVEAGGRFVFFPEGTFYRTCEMLPFKMGAFMLAAQKGLAVAPVGICGSRRALDSSWMPRRTVITVTAGAPLTASEGSFSAAAALKDKAFQAVQTLREG